MRYQVITAVKVKIMNFQDVTLYLFIYGLLNDAVSYLDYTALNCRMINE
jgi:hypothetical protein